MTDEKLPIKKWHHIGTYVIILLGFLLHYVYDWSNQSKVVAAIAPVNESIWEHLKLGLWAVITFSVIEYFKIGKHLNNYFMSKAAGIIVIKMTIIIIFYSYTFFTGDSILWIDISSYVIGVILSQYICFKIVNIEHSKPLNLAGIIMLILLCITFAIFTYHPPELEIFRDKNLDIFGIS